LKEYHTYRVCQLSSDSVAQQRHEMAEQLGVSELLCRLLALRGFYNADSASKYLEPNLAELPSPFDLKGMNKAVALIADAVASKMQIVIHGDYDVDGITGTSILVDFLQLLGLKVKFHLPNRLEEGYGLSRESIKKMTKKTVMPAVLITVDNGINALKEVQYAKELGYKVIVTDHHKPGQKNPEADAIINPKQKGCFFTKTNISGAAVAFFFIMAIRRKMVEQGVWQQSSMPNLKQYLDLVALGTVADVMELENINRVLVKAGLEVLSLRQRIGIKRLCNTARVNDAFMRADDIAYRLAPRINACGRLGFPEIAAELFVEKTDKRASNLAAKLEQANLERKKLENKALEQAERLAEEQVAAGMQGLVLYGKDWHLGIIGIIAARIVEKHSLPVLVLADDPVASGKVKGSGRSVQGVDIVCALQKCCKILEGYGGHAMAAGITMHANKKEEFADLFNKEISKVIQKAMSKELLVDMVLDKTINFRDLAGEVKLMEPFGKGNHEPVFLLEKITLEQVTILKEHLKFSLRIGGQKIQGIGFFMANLKDLTFDPVDLCFTLRETTYKNRSRVELFAAGIFPTC
jgi:single-stranded-DNA-specific exonuclease